MSLRLKSSVGHNEKFTLQIFHSGEDQRGTAQNFGLFWTKISVFDEKTRFTYVKTNKKKTYVNGIQIIIGTKWLTEFVNIFTWG